MDESTSPNRTGSAADFIALIRPGYWIKNIFVAPGILLAFYFAPELSLSNRWPDILLALVSACLTASSNYVLNEILDASGDARHPDKRFRPIPSGRVQIPLAYFLWAALAVLGLACAVLVNTGLLVSCLALWVMGIAYNTPPIRLKDLPYADVLSESVNNPIRLAIGWYAMGMTVPPTLSVLMAYWMFGAFLMAIKRFAELRHIGDAETAGAYRKSFRWYNEERLLVSILFYAALFGMFSGVFISRYRIELVFAIPFVAAAMAAYFRIGFRPHSPAMNPETLWSCRSVMLSSLLAFGACSALLFLDVPGLGDIFSPRFAPRALP